MKTLLHRWGTPVCLVLFLLPRTVGAATKSRSQSPTSVHARLEKILAVPAAQARLNQLAELGKTLSPAEIVEALGPAQRFGQFRERLVLMQTALRHWIDLEPAKAFHYIAELPDARHKVMLISFAAAALGSDKSGNGADLVLALPPNQSRVTAIAAFAEAWARRDSPRALAWAQSLPDGGARRQALHDVWFIWVHTDPVAAAAHISEVAPGDDKNMLIANIAGDWTGLDPDSAVKWAHTLAEAVERSVALATIAESWADKDPVAASKFALQLEDPTTRQQALGAVVERWVPQAPMEAAAWLGAHIDAIDPAVAMPRLMTFWGAERPAEAAQWIDTLPAGALRESALQAFMDNARHWAPDVATKAAATIVDESVRRQRLQECLAEWQEIDPEAMTAWLREAPLPEDLKGQYLKRR
jgi:hypothetical protein